MLVENRYGALAVLESAAPRDAINRELKRIDPRLFIELQLDLWGRRVWCVVEDVGCDQVPVTVYVHLDESGEPIPYLTDSLIARFKQRSQVTMADIVRQVDEATAKKKERREADSLASYEEVASEFKKMVGRSAVIPRSQALRMSRDRSGENR